MSKLHKPYTASYWRPSQGGIQCELCPRECLLKEGARGFCFVRQNIENEMILTTYGRSSGFCIDPIEKKPLNHFYPGSSILSFGTAGCNLGCKFCQNWDISKSKKMDRLQEEASPQQIALAAKNIGSRSVAFTYNDPVIFTEYAVDIAHACHALDIKTVAVTAGYIQEKARADFFSVMHAANIDLKAFSADFYKKYCLAELEPVLETLVYVKTETDVWLEITTLIIPDLNDSETMIHEQCEWIAEKLGPDVPLHFTAFHPDFKLKDRLATPAETLSSARKIALSKGLNYVYTGNIVDMDGGSTYCPNCHHKVIERNWYQLGNYHLQKNTCSFCQGKIAGHFDETPGNWGHQRQKFFF